MFADYPILCMVTSGRLSAGRADDVSTLLARIGAAAQAGVTLVQIREPNLEARALSDLVAAAVRTVNGTPTRVVVNDRLDVALAAGAHGVHLKERSLPAARARALAPSPFIIGRSVHDPADAVHAGVDYVVVGTVFASASKPGAPAAGLAALQAAVAAARVPVLAIGGITEERFAAVRATGAAGFAAIGFFADGDVTEMSSRCRRARRAFDTLQMRPLT